MKLAFAAAAALLCAAPALAADSSALRVGVVVTGQIDTSLSGNWVSSSTATGSLHHFVISGQSGAVYTLVSLALPETRAGQCDLRVGGPIYELQPISRSRYAMRYLIQAADVMNSSTDADACAIVAEDYLASRGGAQQLMLARASDGRLIDAVSGAAYARTR